jgi:hypothetical protein
VCERCAEPLAGEHLVNALRLLHTGLIGPHADVHRAIVEHAQGIFSAFLAGVQPLMPAVLDVAEHVVRPPVCLLCSLPPF